MKALLVLNYDVHDVGELTRYREVAGPLICEDHDGQLVTSSDNTEHLDEAAGGGTHTVIIGYPNLAAARRAYGSPAYQAVLSRRLAATTPRAAFFVPVTGL